MAGDGHDARADRAARWAGAFDPAANVRALGDIQLRGLRAAAEVVERLVAAVDGVGGTEPAADGTPAASTDLSSADLLAAADLWAVLARRSLEALAGLATSSSAPVPPVATTVDVGTGSPPAALRLAFGGEAAEVWFHNGTQHERRDLRLHCGDLHAHDGAALGAALTFEPEVVDVLPGRSSRGVTVAVGPPEDGTSAVPGTYRGLVLVAGLSDVWLPVQVTVGS